MGIYDRDWYNEHTKISPIKKGNRNTQNSVLTNTLIWLGLGTLCFSLFTWIGSPKIAITGNQIEIVIPRAQDGHHYIEGTINGKQLHFLIDTGASYVSVGGNIASQLGLISGKPTRFETANGTVTGQIYDNQSIKITGLATPPLTIGVMPNSPNTALLGQNFLRHVELIQVDGKLIIKGRSTGLATPSPTASRAKNSMYSGLALLFLAWLSSYLLKGPRHKFRMRN